MSSIKRPSTIDVNCRYIVSASCLTGADTNTNVHLYVATTFLRLEFNRRFAIVRIIGHLTNRRCSRRRRHRHRRSINESIEPSDTRKKSQSSINWRLAGSFRSIDFLTKFSRCIRLSARRKTGTLARLPSGLDWVG